MIEAILNSLDLSQQIGVVMLIALVPMAICLHIAEHGGLAGYLAVKRRRRQIWGKSRK